MNGLYQKEKLQIHLKSRMYALLKLESLATEPYVWHYSWGTIMIIFSVT